VNLLFICSKNRLRSPTAEQVFADWPGMHTASAGVNLDADNPVSPELLEWADLILVMEPVHRRKLASKFRKHLSHKRVVSLGIPDDYQLMQPELVDLLKRKVTPYLQ
jgi:predicted protein tyrosine phosphatase